MALHHYSVLRAFALIIATNEANDKLMYMPPPEDHVDDLISKFSGIESYEELTSGAWIKEDDWDLLEHCWKWVLIPALDVMLRSKCRGILLVIYGASIQPGLHADDCQRWTLLGVPDNMLIHSLNRFTALFGEGMMGTRYWPELFRSTGGIFLDIGSSSDAKFTKDRLLAWRPNHIHMFEPIPEHFVRLRERWSKTYRNVTMHNYGLASKTKFDVPFHLLGGSTSAFHQLFLSAANGGRLYLESLDGSNAHRRRRNFGINDGLARIGITVRSVSDVWHDLGLQRLELLNMNCEGCEYEVLPALADEGLLLRVEAILVQTHLVLNDTEVAELVGAGNCSLDGSCVAEALDPALHRYCGLVSLLRRSHRRIIGLPLNGFQFWALE